MFRDGRLYRAGCSTRLTVDDVRTRTFGPRWRGVDPAEVHDFQLRVADELTALHREAWLLRQENDRLKHALREWQTAHAHGCHPPQYPHNTRW